MALLAELPEDVLGTVLSPVQHLLPHSTASSLVVRAHEHVRDAGKKICFHLVIWFIVHGELLRITVFMNCRFCIRSVMVLC